MHSWLTRMLMQKGTASNYSGKSIKSVTRVIVWRVRENIIENVLCCVPQSYRRMQAC